MHDDFPELELVLVEVLTEHIPVAGLDAEPLLEFDSL